MKEDMLLKEMRQVVEQLEVLIQYINEKVPVLTKAGNLGKKDCYALNYFMREQMDVKEATKGMDQYPSIYFWYNLLMGLNIYNPTSLSSTKKILQRNQSYKRYMQLNWVEKYMMILDTYFTELKPEQLYGGTATYMGFAYNKIVETLDDLIKLELNQDISINWAEQRLYQVEEKYEKAFCHSWKLFYSLKSLGLCELELVENKGFYSRGDKILVRRLSPTNLGKVVLKDILEQKCLKSFLKKDTIVMEDYEELFNMSIVKNESTMFNFPRLNKGQKLKKQKKPTSKGAIPSAKSIERMFVQEIDRDKIHAFIHAGEATGSEHHYILKVEFKNAPRTWVKMQVDGQATLDDLSKAILDAIEFDDDHLYAFYMDNKPWSNDAYYDPRGAELGERSAAKVRLNELKLRINKQFIYLYDFGDEWLFTICCKEINEGNKKGISILQTHGKVIEQYPEYDEWE